MINLPSETTLWKTAAIGLGLITGIAVISFLNQLNFMFYPVPESLDGNIEKHSVMLINNNIFLSGKIIAVITGSFFAGALPKLVNKNISYREIIFIGIIMILVGLIDLMSVSYPVWFWCLSIITYILFTVIGYNSIRNIREQKME